MPGLPRESSAPRVGSPRARAHGAAPRPVKISEEAIRRHSRSLLLPGVGGRGLAAWLGCCARCAGGGAVLDAARLFATRAGIGVAEEPPIDLVLAADESGATTIDPAAPFVLAACGDAGVAVVAASPVAAAPCGACALAAARRAAGRPRAVAPGALALAAGARAAGLALALATRRLELRDGAARTLTFFPLAEPFPASLPLLARPGCECAGALA